MKPATIDLYDVIAKDHPDDQPITVTIGELRALAKPEEVRVRADLAYISRLAMKMRDAVAVALLEREDEGDRVYFGSTNQADELDELAHDIESYDFERVAFAAEKPDLYAVLRALREQLERDPGIEHIREANAAFGNHTAVAPCVPLIDSFGQQRLRSWSKKLAEMAQMLKDEATGENGRGNVMLGLLLIRIQLSVEETGEFAEALASGDIERAFAELLDISYVTDGHYLTLGLGDLKLEGYRETHRANMSKLGPDGKPIISEAGRWIKGPGFQPADIAGVLARNKSG